MTTGAGITWVDVCAFDTLRPDRGACALVAGEQVALYRLSPDDALYAISNYDPFSDAYVLSRGIVGSKGDIPKVASPIFKQNFDLRTGACLDKPEVSVKAWPVRVREGRVEVGVGGGGG
jgi:nitrite reductase (NADH) small subunit